MARCSLFAAILGCAVLFVGGCNSSLGNYECQDNSDCTSEGQSGGICEANAFCSFADSECSEGGQRYGKGSGALSGQCVRADGVDAGVRNDASPGTDAAISDAAIGSDAGNSCLAGDVIMSAPGTFSYTVPEGCTTLSIQAFGAGGGGAKASLDRDSGAGGGAGSGVQLSATASDVLIAAGGGGGGSTDDGIVPAVGGGGGGGGYASAVFTVLPGTKLTIVVGQGGRTNELSPIKVGANGGDPGGGPGGDHNDGMPPTTPWGGGGGAGDNGDGGPSIFGGGGGTDEDGTGGGSTYGGAGSGGQTFPACGQTTFGGPCVDEAGGGGGFFVAPAGSNAMGTLGDPGSNGAGGDAAEAGPGEGGDGGEFGEAGADGRVMIQLSE